MKPRFAGLIAALVTAVIAAPAAQSNTARTQLEAARKLEVIDGDLKGAIKKYSAIVETFKNDRPVVADALVRLAGCYEKQGDAQARKIYEQVLRDYADQKDAVTLVRARLGESVRASGLTARRVMADSPDLDTFGSSVSYDGRFLSIVEWTIGRGGDLAIRDLGTGETRRLTNAGPGEYPDASVISRDGSQVAYSWLNDSTRYDLRVISRDGGQPRVLYRNEQVQYVQPFDWSPDGKQIVVVLFRSDRTNQIALVSAADGSVVVLKTLDWRYPGKIAFSPDSRYIAYDFPPIEDAPERDILVIAADGSREATLVKHPANDYLLGWFQDGTRVLFASDRTGTDSAWTIRVAGGTAQGEVELLKPDIGRVHGIGFTKAGAFYYGRGTAQSDVYIATLDPVTGQVVDGPSRLKGRYESRKASAAWSPDGEQLAYLSEPPQNVGSTSLSIFMLRTGQIRNVLLQLRGAFRLAWQPDSRAVVVQGQDFKGRPALHRVDLSTGNLEPLAFSGLSPAFSPDGRRLFFAGAGGVTMRDLITGENTNVYARPIVGFALSPDGRWIALKNRDAPPATIQIVPASGGEARELNGLTIPKAPGFALAWSADGKYVFVGRKSGEDQYDLFRMLFDGGSPQKLAIALKRITHLSAHPDGRRLAITAGRPEREVWVMENFLPPLKAAR